MKPTRTLKRRDFIKRTGKGAASLAAAIALGRSGRAGASIAPSDRIVVGLIGCGGMGSQHLADLSGRADVEVAAVCDVSIPRYETARNAIGGRCKGYQDWRRVIDRNDIDAVFVTTPDHWHALMTVTACEAGKDVYVEKPMTTTVTEGRRVVETARRCGSVVQVGLQQRSMPVYEKAIALVRAGDLGRIVRTSAWVGTNGGMFIESPQEPPPDLDWDMWLGPAPWVPYSPQRFGAFRAFDDYAGGEMTNWGVHLIDIALWAMNRNCPLSVQALGGSYRQPPGDDHETLEVVYEFPGCSLVWSQAAQHFEIAGKGYGTQIIGDRARLIIDRASFVVKPASLGIPEYRSVGNFFIQLTEHHDNFFESVRTRRRPAADCEIGHYTTTTCLLGNIAVDCRHRLVWDGAGERFVGDEAANRHLYRPYRAPWRL